MQGWVSMMIPVWSVGQECVTGSTAQELPAAKGAD